MDRDLFSNTLATNGLSAGKPHRNKKPRRFGTLFLSIILGYLLYHFTNG